MKKTIYSVFVLFCATHISAQVGIGTDTPNAYTLLEAKSSSQGFLIPRISNANRDANLEDNQPSTTTYNFPCGGPGNPCEVKEGVTNNSILPIGTLIFNTDAVGYEFWNGTTWTSITGSAIGSVSNTLPEIGAIDAAFSGTAVEVVWDDANYTGATDNLAGPVPYGGAVASNVFPTDMVLIGFAGETNAGVYSVDNRSADIRASNLFNFKPATGIATGLNTVFFPESDEGTYDFQFTFDLDVNSGGTGNNVVLSAWFGSDIVQCAPANYNAAPVATISMSPNQLVRAANPVTFPGDPAPILGRPFLQVVKVFGSGNNSVYPGYVVLLRVLSSADALSNGVVFTIQSPGAEIDYRNMKVLVTRVR